MAKVSAGALLLLLLAPAGFARPITPQAAVPADASSESVQYDLVRTRERFEPDGGSTTEQEVQVLLRSATAVASFGQIGSSYLDGSGDVRFESVVIGKPDGRTVEVRGGLVEDVNPFGVTGTSAFAGLRFKKLTIPGLEPGDRLSYRIVTLQKPLATGHIFGQVKFYPILGNPVQTYELDLPRSAPVRVRLREKLGAAWEDVPAAADRLVRRLSLTVERPDFDPQKLTKATIESWSEPDVIFTTFSSWAEVGQWWWTLSRDRLEPDAAVKAQAAQLVASKGTPRERIEALHGFVASRIRYVNVSFDAGRMQPLPAAQILANRYGDCKDKHAVLAALASSVGIDVRPVFINSVRSDLYDDTPSPHQFNHMISVARLGPDPADWLWLDATNPFAAPGYLVPGLRDKRALLVETSGEGRIVRTRAEPPFVPRKEVELKGTLQSDGTLRARAVWRIRSDDELLYRAGWAATPQDKRAEAVRVSLACNWTDGKVTNVSMSDPLAVAEPLQIEFEVERPAPSKPAEGEGSLWIPLPDFELPEAEASQPPAGEPIKLGLREFSAQAEIEVAEALSLRAPLSVSLDRAFGRFESTYSVEGKTLKLRRTLTLSRQSISSDEAASYEAFRKTIDTDRDQKFLVLGGFTPSKADSAESLHTQGLDAFKQKDYLKAVELLSKATETDAKVKDGFLDLGRALVEAKRHEDALRAFSRQIENDPFHASAYSWRAYVLDRLGRAEEGEKDFLKQIEVAPFGAWSYQRLGERRTGQRRFREAAEFYSKVAAIEPKVPGHWVDLAWAEARAGRAEEARAALARARILDLPDWMKISAGGVYDLIGEPGSAAELAEAGLVSVAQRLAALSADGFGENDLWLVEYLARAWHLIGAAAIATGDPAKGERYLDAAWKVWFLPEAGWALGNLREKQGRLAEAVAFWSMAADVPTAEWRLPADRQSRIEEACRRLPSAASQLAEVPGPATVDSKAGPVRVSQRVVVLPGPAPQIEAQHRLSELRTIAVTGPVLTDLTETVLLLTSPDGKIESVRDLSRKDPATFERQIARFGPIRMARTSPDERPFKAVRRGLLICSRAKSCTIVLDMPGMASSAEASYVPEAFKVLNEADKDRMAGRHQQALEKYQLFHRTALKPDSPSLSALFSHTLGQWLELAREYPPALTALRDARDEALESFKRDRNDIAFALFAEMNRTLGEEGRTVESFSLLDKQDPERAGRVFARARPALIRAKEYVLCGKYLRPKEDLATAIEEHQRGISIEVQGPSTAGLRRFAGERFTSETTTLVALLVVNGREGEAKDIATAAERELDDPAYRAAIEKALQGVVPEPRL